MPSRTPFYFFEINDGSSSYSDAASVYSVLLFVYPRSCKNKQGPLETVKPESSTKKHEFPTWENFTQLNYRENMCHLHTRIGTRGMWISTMLRRLLQFWNIESGARASHVRYRSLKLWMRHCSSDQRDPFELKQPRFYKLREVINARYRFAIPSVRLRYISQSFEPNSTVGLARIYRRICRLQKYELSTQSRWIYSEKFLRFLDSKKLMKCLKCLKSTFEFGIIPEWSTNCTYRECQEWYADLRRIFFALY